MQPNRKSCNVFKTTKCPNFYSNSIKLEIPMEFFNDSKFLKCPFCSYITDKTYNWERHKANCRKKIDSQPISNNSYFSIYNNRITNNSINVLDENIFNQKIINAEPNYNYDENKNSNKFHISTLKKLFIETSHLNCQEINFGNYYVYDKHALDWVPIYTRPIRVPSWTRPRTPPGRVLERVLIK